jgi:hypothetical protein
LQSLSRELGFENKIHIKCHGFAKHDEVVPVFLEAAASILNARASTESHAA